MSVEAMSWVWKHSEATGTHLLVLLCIADFHGEQGAWPRIATLAKRARTGERTVQRAIDGAVKRGELAVHYQAGQGGANLYTLPMTGDTHDAPTPTLVTPPKDGEGDTGDTPRVTLVTEKGDTHDAPITKPPGTTKEPSKTLAPARRRDEVFEAVAEVCGIDWDGGLTDAGRAPLNRAVADIKRAGGTTEAEVRLRAANYSTHFPGATLTPSALAKHWPQLLNGARPQLGKGTQGRLERAAELERQGR